MKQMYKIYVNTHVVRILEEKYHESTCIQLTDSKQDMQRAIAEIRKMLAAPASEMPACLEIIAADAKAYLKKLKLSVLFIKAAGGIIKNELGEYLFIFRRGKWDLPKGKLEEDEKPGAAALREVEEECGVRIKKIKKELESTFHIYEQHGRIILKRTHWFLMMSQGPQILVPQVEEGITGVRWMKPSEFDIVTVNTFPSIIDVLSDDI